MDNKNEIIKNVTDIVFCPPEELMNSHIDIEKAEKFPIEKVAILGTVFQPVTQLASYAAGGAGQSGLYFVNTAGKTMFKSGNEYIGSLKNVDGLVGGGQARMTQIPLDPTMLCMAVALMAVEKKLDAIQEGQKEILDFLEMKEASQLKGNLNALTDILNNYKYNWDNEKYKYHNHIEVKNILRAAEQSLILYKEQLEKMLNKRHGLSNEQEISRTIKKAINKFNDYHLALYTFAYASFLEVLLLENFDTNYLNNATSRVKDYELAYDKLHDNWVEKIESKASKSIESFALKGLSKVTGGAGKVVEKIPVINKSQIDENLIKAGDWIANVNEDRIEKSSKLLTDSKVNLIRPFVENIETIDIIYNKPHQLVFDTDNIYVLKNNTDL